MKRSPGAGARSKLWRDESLADSKTARSGMRGAGEERRHIAGCGWRLLSRGPQHLALLIEDFEIRRVVGKHQRTAAIVRSLARPICRIAGIGGPKEKEIAIRVK